MSAAKQLDYRGKAALKKVGISPTKMKLAVDQLRGLKVGQALGILQNTNRAANPYLINLIRSAIANARQKDETLKPDDLKIKSLITNQGQSLKRFRPRAMGRGNQILKRSCQVYIELN